MIEFIAEGDTIIFNFPLSIFNSAAKGCPLNSNFHQQKTEPINIRFRFAFIHRGFTENSPWRLQ